MGSRLARRLGLFDAVVVGLGAMLGAGVFSAFAPAARAAGNALIAALIVAALVAALNAYASARLAARHPDSGGTYVYARVRLGPAWGFVAGWGFVIGKLASCAAMAMTFGHHVAPAHPHLAALGAVLAVTSAGALGVQKTALITRVLVFLVVVALLVAIVAVAGGGAADGARVWPLEPTSLGGLLQAAGFLFFAFAGYARLATLGEEVLEPARTIPRAIALALGLTLALYLAVAVAVVAGLPTARLAASDAPLAAAVEAGQLAAWGPIVRVGAAAASLGVLLSLTLGVGRTIFAMARNGDLPVALAHVDARSHGPLRAQLAVGALVAAVASVADLRGAIGFSSCAVLVYYTLTHAAAWTLGRRAVHALGIAGCLALVMSLPWASIAGGLGLLASGALVYVMRSRRSRRRSPRPPASRADRG